MVSPSDDEEDNEFYDCDTEGSQAASPPASSFVMDIPVVAAQQAHRTSSDSSIDEMDADSKDKKKQVIFVQSKSMLVQDRACIPPESIQNNILPMDTNVMELVSEAPTGKRIRRTNVPDKPNYPLNLWSIMKNCIGKDLSKIAMPVNFSEPLSMLQRLTEDYEYCDILDVAAKITDPCEQLAYIAAFTISSYSTTANRTGKPFNPLLGETFECDRTDDLGWRSISEQVSHHPPMCAQYCEGKEWRCWQEFTMTSKFRGKYLQVIIINNNINVVCMIPLGFRV